MDKDHEIQKYFWRKKNIIHRDFCWQKFFLDNCIITFYSFQQNHAVPTQRFTNKKKKKNDLKQWKCKIQTTEQEPRPNFHEVIDENKLYAKTDNKTDTNIPTQNHPHNQQPSKAWETPIKLKILIQLRIRHTRPQRQLLPTNAFCFNAHRLLPVHHSNFPAIEIFPPKRFNQSYCPHAGQNQNFGNRS